MRLIDADILRKKLLMMECMEEVVEIIDEQPTAYNIGKVVEELLQCTTCNGHKDHENECGGCAGCIGCKLEEAYYNAIGIVKAGVENE